jgi:hypothetical protein
MSSDELPKNKLDKIKERREKDREEIQMGKTALLSWTLPLTAFLLAILLVEIFHVKPLIIGGVNVLIIIYASTCSIRTWISYAKTKKTSLLLVAILGSLINLLLLVVLGYAISAILSLR